MRNSQSKTKTPRYRAPALEKGLDVLEFLADKTEAMNLSQISEGVGRSKNEIFRILYVLQQRQYLERDPDTDRYTLTNRLFLLGIERPPHKGLLEIALPIMHDLSDETRQSCYLVVPSGEFMVIIARIEPPGDFGFLVRIGFRRPLLQSTAGLVLFAHRPEHERNRWMERYSSDLSKKERAKLLEDAERARADGYAAIPSRVVAGVIDLCAPLLHGSIAVAALTVPYLERNPVTVSRADATKMLCVASGKISSKLP